jgi:hypothetical protein
MLYGGLYVCLGIYFNESAEKHVGNHVICWLKKSCANQNWKGNIDYIASKNKNFREFVQQFSTYFIHTDGNTQQF